MPVKLRLARRGRKQLALFDIVAADARSPRDGKFIEKLGVYNPNTNPATIEIAENKALQWLINGAQPTDTVRRILSYKGVLFKKHLQVGVNKGAISQEQADAKYEAWVSSKTDKIESKKEGLASKKAAHHKARLDAELKINAARAEAISKKNIVIEEVAEPVVEAAAIEEVTVAAVEEIVTPVAATPVVEEVVVPVVANEVAAPVLEEQAAPVAEETGSPVAEVKNANAENTPGATQE